MSDQKFSKHVNTQYNHFKKAESFLKSVYSKTRNYHLTQKRHLELMSELYDYNSFKRLTSSYQGRIYGMADVLFENLFTYHLKFCYEVDGKVLPDYTTEYTPRVLCEMVQSGQAIGRFYWIDTIDSNNPKYF